MMKIIEYNAAKTYFHTRDNSDRSTYKTKMATLCNRRADWRTPEYDQSERLI